MVLRGRAWGSRGSLLFCRIAWCPAFPGRHGGCIARGAKAWCVGPVFQSSCSSLRPPVPTGVLPLCLPPMSRGRDWSTRADTGIARNNLSILQTEPLACTMQRESGRASGEAAREECSCQVRATDQATAPDYGGGASQRHRRANTNQERTRKRRASSPPAELPQATDALARRSHRIKICAEHRKQHGQNTQAELCKPANERTTGAARRLPPSSAAEASLLSGVMGGANLGAVPQMASRSPPAMRRTKVPKSTPPSPWPRSASAMATSAVSLSIPAAATRSETSMMPLLSRSKNVNS